MLIVSSAVGVDVENRTITRTVVGPTQPSTLTWTRLARIEARLVCNVFLPNEISVIRPGLSLAEIDGLTDADPPTVTPGTPLIVTFAFGPIDEPNPRRSAVSTHAGNQVRPSPTFTEQAGCGGSPAWGFRRSEILRVTRITTELVHPSDNKRAAIPGTPAACELLPPRLRKT